MKKLFFMSGLQRSGSTLLGSLLSQNPDFYVSPTSPVLDFLVSSDMSLNTLSSVYTYNSEEVKKSIFGSTFKNFYKHIKKPIIIDKHRGWSSNVNTLKNFAVPNPKLIVTYRPIAEIATSFIKLAEKDPDNAIDVGLKERNLEINNYNRARYVWEEWTYEMYDTLRYGLNNHRENIYVVHYKKLVDNPQEELYNIYDFLELERYEEHYFENIINTLSEQKDELWGFKGLHDIRSSVNYESNDPKDIIGEDLCHYFSVYDKFLKL